MNIYIASDHAGLDLKKQIVEFLNNIFNSAAVKNKMGSVEVFDLGPQDSTSVDYPDYADKVCEALKKSATADSPLAQQDRGILICGSGQGMALRANKYPHIRAALVYSDEIAKLSREHNDANVICLGSRFCTVENAQNWITIFLQTQFSEGRHSQRVAKVCKPVP